MLLAEVHACVLLEHINGVLIKIPLIVVNLNKTFHIL